MFPALGAGLKPALSISCIGDSHVVNIFPLIKPSATKT